MSRGTGRAFAVVAALALVVLAGIALRSCADDTPPTGAPVPAASQTEPLHASSERRAERRAERPRREAAPPDDAATADRDAAEEGAEVSAERSAELLVTTSTPDGTIAQGVVHLFIGDDRLPEQSAPLDDSGAAVLRTSPGCDAVVTVVSSAYLPWSSARATTAAGTQRIDAALQLGLEVTGRVVAFDGLTPVPGVRVRVWAPPSGGAILPSNGRDDPRDATTDAEGRFRVRGLVPGTVNLAVRMLEGHAEFGERGFMEVDAGARDVLLRLWRSISIQLEPYDTETGRGLRTLKVELLALEEAGPRGIALASNSELPETSPPPFRLPRSGWSMSGHAVRRFQVRALGYRDSEVVVVDPAEGEPERVIRVPMTPDADSVGTVVVRPTASDGATFAAVVVARFSVDGRSRTGSTERVEEGAVRIDVQPGPVHLRIAPPRQPRDPIPWWLPQDLHLDVAAGTTVTRDVVLQVGGALEIRGPKGQQQTEQPVRVLRAGEEVEPEFHLGGDAEGHAFIARPLATGDYVLEFRREGENLRIPCQVRAKETTLVRLPEE